MVGYFPFAITLRALHNMACHHTLLFANSTLRSFDNLGGHRKQLVPNRMAECLGCPAVNQTHETLAGSIEAITP